MFRFLVVNDPHVSDRPPLGREATYCEDMLDKLVQVRDIAEEYNCAAVLQSGDLFHVKRAPYVSHYLVARLIDLYHEYPCQVLAIAGNHDLSSAGMASLGRQPLGVLAEAGVIRLLDAGTVTCLEYRLVNQGENRPKGRAALVVRPYSVDRDIDPEYYALTEQEQAGIAKLHEKSTPRHRYPPPPSCTIMLTHGSLIPQGETRPYPNLPVDFIDLTGIDLLLGAHIHDPMGLHEMAVGRGKRKRTVYFANYGSLARVSRTALNHSREVVVLMVSVHQDGRLEFEEVTIRTRPGDEVFIQADEIGGEDDAFGAFEFADKVIATMSVEEMSLDEVLAQYAADVPDAIKRRVQHYLAEAGL